MVPCYKSNVMSDSQGRATNTKSYIFILHNRVFFSMSACYKRNILLQNQVVTLRRLPVSC